MDKKKRSIILYSIVGVLVLIGALFSTVFLNPQIKDQIQEKHTPISTRALGSASFTFINSDTGMSAVIQTNDSKKIVIDTGTGNNTFLQDYLNGKEVETLIITSWDSDHTGGLDGLIATCEIKSVYLPAAGDSAKFQAAGIATTIPENGSTFDVSDLKFEFLDCDMRNLATLFVHGQDRILFQGNQLPEQADRMLNSNEDIKVSELTGIILAGNGTNEYFSENLMNKNPKFVLGNITAIGQENSEIDEYVRNKDIDFYNFTYSETVPLHFTSTGQGIQFIGFE
ncbi:MBL fold metallo-hydrolase [Eubacterium limosum]|uniref:MBL fold metallo-hydrolase n=1 Tax=Eubacterium limosum TaxID=1736 RepID=UPI001062809B|nr:MBL fold metallo-hydrolase [Eubacterium limosum]